jgi:hypothetical protein
MQTKRWDIPFAVSKIDTGGTYSTAYFIIRRACLQKVMAFFIPDRVILSSDEHTSSQSLRSESNSSSFAVSFQSVKINRSVIKPNTLA